MMAGLKRVERRTRVRSSGRTRPSKALYTQDMLDALVDGVIQDLNNYSAPMDSENVDEVLERYVPTDSGRVDPHMLSLMKSDKLDRRWKQGTGRSALQQSWRGKRARLLEKQTASTHDNFEFRPGDRVLVNIGGYGDHEVDVRVGFVQDADDEKAPKVKLDDSFNKKLTRRERKRFATKEWPVNDEGLGILGLAKKAGKGRHFGQIPPEMLDDWLEKGGGVWFAKDLADPDAPGITLNAFQRTAVRTSRLSAKSDAPINQRLVGPSDIPSFLDSRRVSSKEAEGARVVMNSGKFDVDDFAALSYSDEDEGYDFSFIVRNTLIIAMSPIDDLWYVDRKMGRTVTTIKDDLTTRRLEAYIRNLRL